MKEWKKFAAMAAVFLVAYLLPLGHPKIRAAIFEAFRLIQWYARMHTLTCVVPAIFIAGARASTRIGDWGFSLSGGRNVAGLFGDHRISGKGVWKLRSVVE